MFPSLAEGLSGFLFHPAASHHLYLHRQMYPLRRTPSSGSGPSPPMETPRARSGFLAPSSPAATSAAQSISPPMSEFSVLPGPPSGERMRGRGSSFSAGGGTPLSSKDFLVMEANLSGGQLRRTGRGSAPVGLADHMTSLERCNGHV